ncbi:type I-C CRISPR-associated protein Cas8c/Csd1 [Brevibacillus agri]|uniref:helix-turn-helix domain-containing protein n=1 Tax=Brevibacillus agri TaxID=51101 RepID=UPI003D255777
MNRDLAFGRLLAIANVLSERVFEEGRQRISTKYLTKLGQHPAKAFEKIHAELMEYAHCFGEEELYLMDLFGEILAEMDEADFSNEPLNGVYLQAYYSQQHSLHNAIGVEEAAEIWGLSPGYVKNLCANNKIIAKKIGKTWVVDKTQPNPKNLKEQPSPE